MENQSSVPGDGKRYPTVALLTLRNVKTLVALIFLAWVFYGVWGFLDGPPRINSSTELEASVGKTVSFVAEYDGSNERWDLLHFDGTTLLIDYSARKEYDRPKTGQTLPVTGYIRWLHHSDLDLQYSLSEPSWDLDKLD